MKDIGGYNEMKFLPNKYNENKKFIFVHIPKNGGSSIERMLGMGGGIFSVKDFASELDINKYYKFGFVRNPFDRLVSAYTYLKSGKELVDRHFYNIVTKYPTINNFIIDFLNKEDNLYKIPHFTPQHLWLKLDGEYVMDYIGKVENYNESVKEIFSAIGLKHTQNIVHTNKSNRGDYRNYFNDETVEIVSNLYFEDMSDFNYKF